MANQARFTKCAAVLSIVFASGAFAPVAADPFSSVPDPIAYSPGPVDSYLSIELGSLATSLEHADVRPGSATDDPDEVVAGPPVNGPSVFDALLPVEPLPASGADPVRVRVASIADPFAEAFAESARIPMPRPAYPVVINAQVQAFIERFTGSRREVVGTWLDRSTLYLTMIRSVLREQGLPEELAFVAMIESGFNPLAVSRAGAKGLWQFMAGTARGYGLRVDQWVDERLDPEKSTAAAAAYLRDLYKQFGSWALAKAAYNAGEVRVIQAIRRVGSTDFWTLAGSRFLQQETKEFVPAIHAATVIGRDPGRFGFEPESPEPMATEIVRVPPETSLTTVASVSRIPLETLRSLNPVLLRGSTPPGGPYELRVPVGTREVVARGLSRPRPQPSVVASTRAVSGAPQVHVVRSGDTVTAIARKYGVSVDDVLRWNGRDRKAVIRPGDRLRVAGSRVQVTEARSTPGGRSAANR
jgi:membrane-bound lytic murein transglycosylase D